MDAKATIRPKVEGEQLKIAETVLKRRHYTTNLRAERAQRLNQLKKEKIRKHPKFIQSAQSLIKKERLRILDLKRQKYLKRSGAHASKRSDNRILVVVRNDRAHRSAQTKALLKKVGLQNQYNATILSNSDETMDFLKKVEPFVFYGYPSFDNVQKLILKRAALKVKGSRQRVAVRDNTIIDERFGSLGLICIEDVIQEIWETGEHFTELMKSFWPFKLSNLKKVEGINAKKCEFGNMGKAINEKLQQII